MNMTGTWRLILTPPARGAWNMAVDEAILEAAGRGEVPPTLRLYAWERPCLSLGYAQSFSDVDLEALQARAWQVVRRPTGGRAILHSDELTYSICGPHNLPLLKGSVLESYRRIAAILLHALHSLGVPAQALPRPQPAPGSDPKGPVCFEVPSNYEITVHGKKLLGSAQARKQVGVLQHGSLPLYGDLTRITQVLRFPDEGARQQAAQRLLGRATTVAGATGKRISWETAAQAMIRAFTEQAGLPLAEGALTPEEQQRAEVLLQTKHADQAWVRRRA